MKLKFKLQYFLNILVITSLCFFVSCTNEHKNAGEDVLVTTKEEIDNEAEGIIQQSLKDILKDRHIADSFGLKNVLIIEALYDQNSFHPLWSSEGKYLAHADSLFSLVDSSRLFGLFPEDYYASQLDSIRKAVTGNDSTEHLNAGKWALSDLLLTSAFIQMMKDLKWGRLLPDSVIQKDSAVIQNFFSDKFTSYKKNPPNNEFAGALEPKHKAYVDLKIALRSFLDSSDLSNHTFIHAYDSGTIRKLAYKRLGEEDSIKLNSKNFDSLSFVTAIKQYQKIKGLKVDGKLSTALVNKLNNTGKEKFTRIAITLDRYKALQPLPSQYVWVNIPTYYLTVKENDTVVLTSKVVVGKTYTRTPELSSAISDMITYPQWTIPASIIAKEILPGLQKDPGYTNRKGYSILDNKGNVIDPYFIDWSQYKKGIPYRVVQGSGDANALGVLKFNFPNKHSVYLHDTNQRYLFSRTNRALSHGCVRVESWKNLANYILKSDSLSSAKFTSVDSLNKWLSLKQKRVIPVRKKVPVFIKYFTCEGVNGKIVFYDDIYDEDRKLRNKFFATK